ncbi:MAG: SsrA-binding protein SmpB [Bacteroidia bacterium]|nr:SsrA-binding protein SmpB [Bacteroidia bacterium]
MTPTIVNRRAIYDYHFLERFSAGMILKGTEIKSLRLGKAQLIDAFCMFIGNELYVRGMEIAPYTQGTYNNVPAKRDRKLLLSKKELSRLLSKMAEKGLTIIPTKIFFSDRGFAKIEIALAKGKKDYDKRSTIKEREQKREIDRHSDPH